MTGMKIGIDARMYGPAVGGGGIGRYVQELVTFLPACDGFPPCVAFVKPENADALPGGYEKRVVDVHWYTLREQIALPRVIDRERLDLVHIPHWNVPLALRTPFVVTIHDLILLDEPRSARATTRHPLVFALKQAGFRRVLRHALFASRRVIAVSEATKRSILRHFPALPPEKIDVIYEGVTALPSPDESAAAPKPYLLSVGNAYPHKNLEALLRAFRLAREAHPGVRLVLAGRDDVFARRLSASPEARALGDAFIFVPNPTDAQLAALYQKAAGYVYPSRLEGFGLPPLEAMSQGAPVAAARAGSLPEVLGDAARFFDPRDERDMARALEDLVGDAGLRRALVERGFARVRRYSWRRMAEETLASYRRALERSNPCDL